MIGLSWSIVISVGGFLIVQTYGEEVGKGPPFADQAMAVAEVLERTPAPLRPEVLRAVTSNYFDVALQPDATEPSADNFQASMLTFRFLTQNTFSQNTRRGPGAMEVLSILAGLQRPGPEIDGLEATRLIRLEDSMKQPWIVAMTANARPEDASSEGEVRIDTISPGCAVFLASVHRPRQRSSASRVA